MQSIYMGDSDKLALYGSKGELIKCSDAAFSRMACLVEEDFLEAITCKSDR